MTLWRDGVQRVSWTDSTPLTSGQYLALRTSQSSVSFDNVRVSAQSGVVTYLHADHLGSVSLMTNQVGSALVNTTARYFPFGDWRTKPTADLTDRGFTGHLHNNLGSGANDLGLIYMNARFYVPGLGRFASADTIVPDPANPQSFNRYSYVENQPLNYTDPTGHCKHHQDCLVDGASQGPVVNSAYSWLLAKVFIDYVIKDLEIKHAGGYQGDPNVGIAVNGDLADWIWNESIKQVDQIVAANGGDSSLALQNYNMLDYMADGIALTMMSTGLHNVGAAPFGQPLPPRSILSGNTSSSIIPSRGFMAQYDCSFSADTLVMTADGLVPISQVPVGEMVLAYNEEMDEIGYYPVIAVWAHQDPVIVFLTIEGETIETTPNHPFFTVVGEWVQAGSLQPGDEIRDAAWGTGTVEAVTFSATPQTMYNFTVATAHTYFVGNGQWLVHNQHCGLNNSQLKAMASELGHTNRIPSQKAPFNSHGQTAYYNSKTKTYITHDVDGHRGGVWKMFDHKGNRIGTFNKDLTVQVGP